jgi:predicted DCC family thiol-disulfide oxidoreductase YuxK
MHVVLPDGTVCSGGDAVIELLALRPKTRPVAWLARALPPVRAWIRRAYNKTAANRAELANRVPDRDLVVDPPQEN